MWTWIDKYFDWLKRLLDHRGIKKQKIARAGRPYEHDWLMKRWHVDRASRKFSHAVPHNHAQCHAEVHSHVQECTAHRRARTMQRFTDGCVGHDSRSGAPERKQRFLRTAPSMRSHEDSHDDSRCPGLFAQWMKVRGAKEVAAAGRRD
jgi:hypothetical protein